LGICAGLGQAFQFSRCFLRTEGHYTIAMGPACYSQLLCYLLRIVPDVSPGRRDVCSISLAIISGADIRCFQFVFEVLAKQRRQDLTEKRSTLTTLIHLASNMRETPSRPKQVPRKASG